MKNQKSAQTSNKLALEKWQVAKLDNTYAIRGGRDHNWFGNSGTSGCPTKPPH